MVKKSIFIVEDEAIAALGLKMKCQMWGYEVTGVSAKGREAISSIMENPPDLVLLDIFLADDVDGIEVANEITKNKQVPIIYITASEDPETYRRIKETEYYDLITKPYDAYELQQLIDRFFVN